MVHKRTKKRPGLARIELVITPFSAHFIEIVPIESIGTISIKFH